MGIFSLRWHVSHQENVPALLGEFLRDLHDAEDHHHPNDGEHAKRYELASFGDISGAQQLACCFSAVVHFLVPPFGVSQNSSTFSPKEVGFFSQPKMVCFFFPCQCHGMAVWHPPPKMLNAMPLLRSMLPSLCTWFAALGPVALNLDSKPLWQTDWLITTSLQ